MASQHFWYQNIFTYTYITFWLLYNFHGLEIKLILLFKTQIHIIVFRMQFSYRLIKWMFLTKKYHTSSSTISTKSPLYLRGQSTTVLNFKHHRNIPWMLAFYEESDNSFSKNKNFDIATVASISACCWLFCRHILFIEA